MNKQTVQQLIKEHMRAVKRPGIKHLNADFPFLFANKEIYPKLCTATYNLIKNEKIDYVASVEATGLPIGGYLAQATNAGFIMIRKENLLGIPVIKSEAFTLPYRNTEIRLEIQKDIPLKNKNVVLFDEGTDTGATLQAATELLKKTGANVNCVVTITNYPNIKKISSITVKSLLYGEY